MKAWLKGGLIGAGIGFIIYFINLIKCTYYNEFSPLPVYCQFLNKFTVLIHRLPPTHVLFNHYAPFLSLISTVLIYFIIGLVIGFIVSKIRRNKR